MMVFGLALLLLAAAYGLVVARCVTALGLSIRQAALYAPFKIIHRISDRVIREARLAGAPVIYVVRHSSRLDPALMLAMLPEDTLHILDAEAAGAGWLEPFRGLARTIQFKPEHVFVSRRLVRVLKGRGRIAVYMPDTVEPEARAYRLYRAVARIALQADAAIVPIVIDGSETLASSLIPAPEMPRRVLPKLAIVALEPMTVGQVSAATGSSSAAAAVFDRLAEARLAAAMRRGSVFGAIRDAAIRLGPERPAIEDEFAGPTTYRQLLASSRRLGSQLARRTGPDETVALLLPGGLDFMRAFIGLQSAGRAVMPLDPGAAPGDIADHARTALLRTVLASRGAAEAAEGAAAAGARVLWIEDLEMAATTIDRAAGALLWRRPIARQRGAGQPALLFADGPDKAAAFDGRAALAQAAQIRARLAIGPRDRLFSLVPAWTPAGLALGITMPLMAGARIITGAARPMRAASIDLDRLAPTILAATDADIAALASATGDRAKSGLRLCIALDTATETSLLAGPGGARMTHAAGFGAYGGLAALSTAVHERPGTAGRPLPGMRLRLKPGGSGTTEHVQFSGPGLADGVVSRERPGHPVPPASLWRTADREVGIDRDGFLTVRPTAPVAATDEDSTPRAA